MYIFPLNKWEFQLEARCDAGRVDDRQDGLLAWAKGPEALPRATWTLTINSDW